MIFPCTMLLSINGPKSPHGLLNEDELYPTRRKGITKMLGTIQYIPLKLENIRCYSKLDSGGATGNIRPTCFVRTSVLPTHISRLDKRHGPHSDSNQFNCCRNAQLVWNLNVHHHYHKNQILTLSSNCIMPSKQI